MSRGFFHLLVLALLLEAFTFVSAIPQDANQEIKVEKSACFECHGSFDEIAAATADYVTPSGEIATPHQYIPHQDKKGIPECAICHESHPILLESNEQIVKPDYIDWCYTSCHHSYTLQPCITCH
jgi:hypothetical protein